MLGDAANWLFAPGGLTAHGFCLLWEPWLVWTNATTNIAVGLAYVAIATGLAVYGRRRPDLPFRPVLWLFAAFVLLCGADHWLDALTLWMPAYRLEAVVQTATALISGVTAVTVWLLLPKALDLPSPAQMRQVNDALRISETRVRQLLGGVFDHAVYLLDADGHVETWNPGAERIKGYRPEEIIGRHFSAFFTAEQIAAGEPARLLAEAREQGHVMGKFWRLRKGGSQFWAQVAITAIRDAEGVLRGFAKITHDLTDSEIEAAQRNIIMEAAAIGMLLVDEAGKITLANSQAHQIFGYPEGALNNQPVEVLVPDAVRTAHARLRTAYGDGSGQGMSPLRQFTGRRQDGSIVVIEVVLSPVRTPHGSIVVASVFDMTERLRRDAEREASETLERYAVAATNARLEQLARHLAQARDKADEESRAKSRFLAGVTHELRTPLNGVLGYAQLLQLEGGLTPTQTTRVEAMLAAGTHLLGMINSVLDLSQIEADRLHLQPVAIELPMLASACLDVVRPAAEAKGVALSLAVDVSAPVRLEADATRVRQVLVNLLGNAVKFTTTGGVELRVKLGEAIDSVRLEVLDTGPGIGAEHRSKLFQHFERLTSNEPGIVEGSGLGLAIAAQLVRRMGGEIGYAPRLRGGSVFWFELPINVAAPGAPGIAPPRSQAVDVDVAKLRILVVDDVAMNRDVAGAMLRLAGHAAVTVGSGQAAIEAASASDFDLVLMDVRMPQMDGLEATRRIRALPEPRGNVPVVALTAQAFTDQIEKCRAAGMNGHLSKPLEQAALLAVIANVTANRLGERQSAAAAADLDIPYLDQATFQTTARILQPRDLDRHLRTLIERSDALLAALRAPDAFVDAGGIADAAHTLGGSAGTFGFRRLAAATRRFEHDFEHQASDLAADAAELAGVIEVSAAILHDLVGAAVAAP